MSGRRSVEPDGPGTLRRFASTLFRHALVVLPRGFRARYGAELVRDYEEAAAKAEARRGALGVLGSLLAALVDLIGRAPFEHRATRRSRRPDDGEGTMKRTGWGELCARETLTSARGLARRPAFSTLIVVTLALGIGANVAIFTVVDGVLLEPLAFPGADRIVSVRHQGPGIGFPQLEGSLGLLNIYRRGARTLEAVAAVDRDARNLSGGDRPERALVAAVTEDFFRVVGVEPALGRTFTAEELAPGGPPVAILTADAWSARFGRDRGVLGRTVRIDGVATEIVGVMPPGFAYPDAETALLLPLPVPADAPFGFFGRPLIARLAEGVSLEDARREVEALQPRIFEYDTELPPDFLEQARWGVTVIPLRDRIVGDARATLWIVLATVGLVLLIACANVANLFLVRAEGRRREVAVRAALGADRAHLAVSFLSESLLLGLAAGAVGVALAMGGVEALVRWGPQDLPRLHEVGLDGSVLLFALVLSLTTGSAFGSLPVVRYLGRSFAEVLRDGGRGVTEGRRRHCVRNVLVVGQLALAMVLLVGAGLMVRSFQRLTAVDLGVATDGVTAVGVSWGEGGGGSVAADFYGRLVDELGGVGGFTSVGATNSLPLRPGGMNGGGFSVESRPLGEEVVQPVAWWTVVSPGFFETMGITLVEGRPMADADGRAEPLHVWVNERFATDFLDGAALGERIRREGDGGRWWEIAGVVGDVRHFGPGEEVPHMIYYPLGPVTPSGATLSSMSVVVAHGGPMGPAVEAVRDVVARLGPEVPVTTAVSMEQARRQAMADTSFTVALLAVAAAMALLLGAVGVYGVISYVVSQRTREIGVRMALGARGREVQRMVVRQGMAVVLVGAGVGLLAALALTRLMRAVLFEVSPTDPLTLLVVPLVLVGVSALACWLPARRAARIDPVRALMAE